MSPNDDDDDDDEMMMMMMMMLMMLMTLYMEGRPVIDAGGPVIGKPLPRGLFFKVEMCEGTILLQNEGCIKHRCARGGGWYERHVPGWEPGWQ